MGGGAGLNPEERLAAIVAALESLSSEIELSWGKQAMQTITLEEAQSHLAEIIDKLPPGEEVVIMHDCRPVARLMAEPNDKPRPILGRCKGMLTIISEDDEHLKDFAEYMP